ncbi:MAG: sigma-70 family RNA polymerase sigma factor [Bauldia sp.]
MEERLRRLMAAALDGNAASYRTLLAEVSERLKAYFLRRLGRDRSADTDDLVQETLMAVHSRRATWDRDRPFTPWLHAVARDKLMDHFRRNRSRQTVPIDENDVFFAEDGSGAAEARLDVGRLLDAIPQKRSDLVRRVRIEGQSIADTAAATGLSEAAVKIGVHRGVKDMSREAGVEGGDGDV